MIERCSKTSQAEATTRGKKPRISRQAVVSLAFSILSLLIFPFGRGQYPLRINDLFINIAGLLGACALILAFVVFVQIPKWARVSLLVGFLCFISPLVAYIFWRPVMSGFIFWRTAVSFGFLALIVSAILAVAILIRKYRVRGYFDRTESAVARRAIPIIGVILGCFCLYYWFARTYIKEDTIMFAGRPYLKNLLLLGKAMRIYASDYAKYPEPNQWCDSLLKHGHVGLEHFVCPSLILTCPYTDRIILYRPLPKRGRCHYAMNPNCEPNSPKDVVLLFETKGGWNQFGGPEILTFENHKGVVCYAVLKDGSFKFVTPEEVGKLKWKEK
jgi:hypothetical protein